MRDGQGRHPSFELRGERLREGMCLAQGHLSWSDRVTGRTEAFWMDSSKSSHRACPRPSSLLVWPLREIPLLLQVKSSTLHNVTRYKVGHWGLREHKSNRTYNLCPQGVYPDSRVWEGGMGKKRRKLIRNYNTRQNLANALRETKKAGRGLW